MTVIHGPTPNHGVELQNQIRLRGAPVLPHDLPNLLQKCLHTFACWFDKQLIRVLADILPEEVEPIGNVSDSGFLFREFQPPNGQKLPDRREYVLLQNIFRDSGHNEVVRIPVDVDFEPSACALRWPRPGPAMPW